MKLEVIVIPIADVDRAKKFYANLGWRLDADFPFDNGFRIVQFTPPGSGCSIQFGTNVTSAAPGSAQGLYLIVPDIVVARDELLTRGVKVSDVFHAGTPGAQFQPDGATGRVVGPAPGRASYGSFATFSDPEAMGGFFRRSLPGWLGASKSSGSRSPRRTIWPVRLGARRRLTASTRSGPASATRTGPTGTPSSWWQSRTA